tara:strand:- start:615 stop:1013 length:399 start_codon:yes stop_codon:yes gene_type:complete
MAYDAKAKQAFIEDLTGKQAPKGVPEEPLIPYMNSAKGRDRRLKMGLLDYVMNNPEFNPRKNREDFADINDALFWTKYIGKALDPKRLGHYSPNSNYFIPNYDVRDFVNIAAGPGDYSERVPTMTKELLKNY